MSSTDTPQIVVSEQFYVLIFPHVGWCSRYQDLADFVAEEILEDTDFRALLY